MEYNYHNPLSITSQFSFCGLPFRLDTYAGCAIGCRYCFARVRGGNIDSKKLKIANPNIIINKFKNALQKEEKGIISEFIRNRVPLHFGGMSDPFQSIESIYNVSYNVLEYLKTIDYPVIISTKSDLIVSDKYIKLLKDYKSLVIQISLSTLDSFKAKILEPNAPNPNYVLENIQTLYSNEISVTIRWQPYIIGVSDEIDEFIDRIKGIGITHIGFEHLKLPIEKNTDLERKVKQITGRNIYDIYKSQQAQINGREYILPINAKIENIVKLKNAINKTGISLGFADNEFQYLSDFDCCCSGVDMFDGFGGWYKPQISYAIKKSYKSKSELIKIENITNEWNSFGSIDKFVNSKSRLKKNNNPNSMFDYILNRWNDLNSSFNPTKYYNIEYTNELDESGNKIYKFGKNYLDGF